MTRDELAKSLYEAAYITGDFLLRSGQRSNEYFDKYRFESQPSLLKQIGANLAPLVPEGTEVLAGLEMGGIPIAVSLSFATGLPVVFVRKEAKSYGTCQFAEGLDIKGKKLCVIEDVITTGGQVIQSTKDLRDNGALIQDVLCVLYRGQGEPTKLHEIDLKMKALFTMDEIKGSQ